MLTNRLEEFEALCDNTDEDDNPFGEDQTQQRDRSWEHGFRVDIRYFDGTLMAEEFTEWIYQVRVILAFKK